MTDRPHSQRVETGEPTGPSRAVRSVNYLGGKLRLLGPIAEALDGLDPSRGPTVDLFTGSAVVAAHLAQCRPVVAVDIQEYARVLASAQLAPARLSDRQQRRLVDRASGLLRRWSSPGLDALLAHEAACAAAVAAGELGAMCDLLEHGCLVGAQTTPPPVADSLAALLLAAGAELAVAMPAATLTRVYGGVYFSYAQALALDCLLAAVREQPARVRDTGLAAAMSAASDCVTSVGSHFAQPIRPRDRNGDPKAGSVQAAVRRRALDVGSLFAASLSRFAAMTPARYPATAVRADFRDFLSTQARKIGAVYADPPYTRDHYSRFYHVLETMARGDVPGISEVRVAGVTRLSRGLYRRERHQSPFCVKSEVRGAFVDLLAGARRLDAPLVLSYSPYSSGTAARPRPRLLTVPQVAELAGQFFNHVEVRSAGRLSHSKFNVVHLNGDVSYEAEILILCRP